MEWGARLAENGLVPDALIRRAIRRMCAERLATERAAGAGAQAALLQRLRSGPIAVAADLANEQHYEVPPAFFEAVLGPRLKYSCCEWGGPAASLAEAEQRMLALTCERAGIEDGMRVLDLGCGWGSLALSIAERFPRCRVVGVSNSKPQREHVLGQAAARGLGNVEVVTADASHFTPEGAGVGPEPFDRVVSIEMFEHVRNWDALLGRVAGWLAGDGRVFLHYFCHRELLYAF
jgi:cyclopropane-fatty-acyl-phospholipid synthase